MTPTPTSGNRYPGLKMTDDLKIFFRPNGQDDWHYICDSWKKSFKESLNFHSPNYFPEITAYINRLVNLPTTQLTMAVDPDDPDFIFGYMCHDAQSIHYIFTRQCFRRADVAKRLVTEHLDTNQPIIATSWTRACEHINRQYNGAIRYEPRQTWNTKKRKKRNGRLPTVTDNPA